MAGKLGFMNSGFGFSFPNNNNDDDDNDQNRNNQNPFGAFSFGSGGGGLGDMLNQFGQMLSGMGTSMNSDSGEPVNYDMAERIARQQIGNAGRTSGDDARAVEDAVKLAELWLEDATSLPSSHGVAKAMSPEEWLSASLPMWKRMVSPVAKHMNEAQLESMPEEAREMMGPMVAAMGQMSSMNFGMQLGHALGDLAKQSLSGSDFGLPVVPAGTTALMPGAITKVSQDVSVPAQEVLVYIAAREAARQRLFKHVPWLVERLVSSVEEYALGLVIDTSHIEEATRELNLESGDPAQLQDAISKLQGMDLSPRIRSRNEQATVRLETLLALVEGWVDVVVAEAMGERVPSTDALNEAWRRRRATGGSAEQAFANVVGIELGAPRVSDAAQLWSRSTSAVGIERRDKVWDHPDFLPTSEHLDNPAAFIDSLLDEAPSKEFDEEFAKLEEMLRNEDNNDKDGNENKGSDSEA